MEGDEGVASFLFHSMLQLIIMDLNQIKILFESHSNQAEAQKMKKYMRDQFDYLGIKSPLRGELKIKLLSDKEFKTCKLEELIPLVYDLWKQDQREYQYLAMELMDRKIKTAKPEIVEHLEFLVVTKPWWDTVDFIASHLVGTFFRIHPELINKFTGRWMKSGNIWLQRTVLLFQLKYRKSLDEKILFDAILKLCGSKEFFIQKAIGWALREYGKINPDSVVAFVSQSQLAPLSKREALRRITHK
jgi:3-methyladenine DNA glycosylase AlkD